MKSQYNSVPPRNLQLDFFRGIALMIIFVNHMPDNPWFWFTPSRFGLSDAADVFVFLSGYASALAYGRCFELAGPWLGSIRVLYRCGQIYAAHLASFLVMAMICVIGNRWMPETNYIENLNIGHFFDNTQQAVFDLFTLTYVPNYFDILPMYLVLLSWVPLVWLLSRIHTWLALGMPVLIYALASHYGWELTADPATGRPWYFNPFNWQLMFFIGFGLGAGWINKPGNHGWLLMLSLCIVLISIPIAYEPIYQQVAMWGELRAQLEPWLNKSHLGLLHCVHLLAMAYLMNRLFSWKPQWLTQGVPPRIVSMGQQSLPIFLCNMGLSYLGAITLDWSGRDAMNVALVNIAGLGLMLSMAQVLAWLDSKPWKAASNSQHSAPLPLVGNLTNPYQLVNAWGKHALLLPLLMLWAMLPALILMTTSNDEIAVPDSIVQAPEPENSEFQKANTPVPDNETDAVPKQRQVF